MHRERLCDRASSRARPTDVKLMPDVIRRIEGRALRDDYVQLILGLDRRPMAQQVIDIRTDTAVLGAHGIDDDSHVIILPICLRLTESGSN